jgi:DNA-binding IscR family transcriptional regulator
VESSDRTVAEHSPSIEMALNTLVLTKLDDTVKEYLSGVSLADLRDCAEKQAPEQFYMMGL